MANNGAGFNPADTLSKQQNLDRYLRWYCTWARQTITKHDWAEFVYIDCNAGPGNYAHKGYADIDGSPIVAHRILEDQFGDRIKRYIWAEWNKNEYMRLQSKLNRMHVPYAEVPDPRKFRAYAQHGTLPKIWIYHGDIEDVLHCLPESKWQFALIYHDPNGKPQYDMLRKFSSKWPKADWLININASAHKRNAQREDRVIDHIRQSIPDKQLFITDHVHGKWQWLMALLTGHRGCGDWVRNGILSADREKASRLIDKVNYRSDEMPDQPSFL
jgi:three-Cys-motif partner protein